MGNGSAACVAAPAVAGRETVVRTRRRTSVSRVAIDAELAERFASGDPDAIRVVYQHYGRLVYSVAYKVLDDIGLAEDATQQTFLQAWRSAATYDPSRPLGPWLATIARRAAIDMYRRERRHRSVDDIESSAREPITLGPSVEQIYELWQVREALDQLPDQDRELIRLQHYDELTHTEIASHLTIPLGTVKSRSFRAHRRLAGLLGHLRSDAGDQGSAEGGAPR